MTSRHEKVITRVGIVCIGLGLMLAVFILKILFFSPPEGMGISWAPLDIFLMVTGYHILFNRGVGDVRMAIPALGFLTFGSLSNGFVFSCAPHLLMGTGLPSSFGYFQLLMGVSVLLVMLDVKFSGVLNREPDLGEKERERRPLPGWLKVSFVVYFLVVLSGFGRLFTDFIRL